jgi:hypothetical protein
MVKGLVYVIIQLYKNFMLELGSGFCKGTFGGCPNIEFVSRDFFVEGIQLALKGTLYASAYKHN